MIRITYLSHSGFLVELDTAYLLFDYYKGDLPELNTGKKFYVFVSHAHYDHFKKDIFKLRDYLPDVYFILSNDVEPDGDGDVMYIGPNEERTWMAARYVRFVLRMKALHFWWSMTGAFYIMQEILTGGIGRKKVRLTIP